MKKIKFYLICVVFAVTSLFVGCVQNKPQSEDSSFVPTVEASSLVTIKGNCVLIEASSGLMPINSNTCLIDYMNKLKQFGALDFSVKDGMIISIIGKENPADWSKCWMLYSNDEELSNEGWGSVTVDEVTYFSAILGAEALPIKDGKTYVWEYKEF